MEVGVETGSEVSVVAGMWKGAKVFVSPDWIVGYE